MAQSYLLYSLTFTCFIFLTALYFTRARWMPLLPSARRFSLPMPFQYTSVPDTPATPGPHGFASDAAAGLHSSTFDLSGNIESGDSRGGLDARGKAEVQRIMRARNVGFDEARRIVVFERFRKEGVGEDGRPRDPKFVSFDRF